MSNRSPYSNRGNAKVVFTLASVALLSCRAVLGIEDIDEAIDAGTGTDSGVADSVRTDADAGTTTDAGTEAGCAPGATCSVCCREPYKQTPTLPEVEKIAKQVGCICDGGACASECGALCGGGMPDMFCIQCLDDALIKATPPACGKALNDCKNNSTCAPVGQCLEKCRN